MDRNAWAEVKKRYPGASSPARGTWIEIITQSAITDTRLVVPRKGDVDRNVQYELLYELFAVVPRKGDVDRNLGMGMAGSQKAVSSPARGTWIEINPTHWMSLPEPRRPPQGGRG